MSKRCMYFEQLTAWYNDIMVIKQSKIHARYFYIILHDIEYLQTWGLLSARLSLQQQLFFANHFGENKIMDEPALRNNAQLL